MFYCKAENKQTKTIPKLPVLSLSLLWLPELGCLLTRQVQGDTKGPRSSTAEALKLYDDRLYLKLALW